MRNKRQACYGKNIYIFFFWYRRGLKRKVRLDYARSHGLSYVVLTHPKSSGVGGSHVFCKDRSGFRENNGLKRGRSEYGETSEEGLAMF